MSRSNTGNQDTSNSATSPIDTPTASALNSKSEYTNRKSGSEAENQSESGNESDISSTDDRPNSAVAVTAQTGKRRIRRRSTSPSRLQDSESDLNTNGSLSGPEDTTDEISTDTNESSDSDLDDSSTDSEVGDNSYSEADEDSNNSPFSSKPKDEGHKNPIGQKDNKKEKAADSVDTASSIAGSVKPEKQAKKVNLGKKGSKTDRSKQVEVDSEVKDISSDSDGEENSSEERTDSENEEESKAGPVSPIIVHRKTSERNWKHEMVRLISLYLVPVVLAIPTSLLLSLTVQLLTPLYNSIPLGLHTESLFIGYTIVLSLIYWAVTLSSSAKSTISARVCFGLTALSGDIVAVYGRRIGSSLGGLLGPEWGPLATRAILGVGVIGGVSGFALLCFDHISPVLPAARSTDRPRNFGSILYRAAFCVFHIYTFERMWSRYLSSNVSLLNRDPEKTILFISLLLTALSLLLQSSSSTTPFPTKVNTLITKSLKLSDKQAKKTAKVTKILPRQAFPLLLLLRIPLLILALRQQIFLRPPLDKSYITSDGELKIISSRKSLTGQIVVAENLKDGYRFLRCDHSILGGRWIREVNDNSIKGGKRTDMGDSIFAVFNLQEIGVLAHRSDPSESLIRTLQLTTELEVDLEGDIDNEESKDPERALIIGLGAGVAASTFARRGMNVDIVEIDPVVYMAANDHFGLSSHQFVSTNIIDGANFVNQLATMKADNETDQESIPIWDYVIQDCFTGGSVPGQMFTKEFWEELGEVVKDDGIITMNFVGILTSKASKAVLVTLTSVFPQCRAFSDAFDVNQAPDEIVNMVVLCTKTYSPLLTFKRPTAFDGLRSPLRSHIYSTFHQNEIQLDSIISDEDYENPEFHLSRYNGNGDNLNKWQIETSLATWRAMQNILTPQMWLAW
ncbi:uncharacterized protein L201_004194 [Kwoniella dendrophila CBS 6074]|uniref:Spermine/spermidine synthase n=1 Tax=Kwoniella dendrophila CBS 6074 TaxID=1295534 RepID=A0AAX4JWR7_9TREE